jgi:hypothetical protein
VSRRREKFEVRSLKKRIEKTHVILVFGEGQKARQKNQFTIKISHYSQLNANHSLCHDHR